MSLHDKCMLGIDLRGPGNCLFWLCHILITCATVFIVAFFLVLATDWEFTYELHLCGSWIKCVLLGASLCCLLLLGKRAANLLIHASTRTSSRHCSQNVSLLFLMLYLGLLLLGLLQMLLDSIPLGSLLKH